MTSTLTHLTFDCADAAALAVVLGRRARRNPSTTGPRPSTRW